MQNPKRTYRLYCRLGMQVRTKRRKKLVRPRVPIQVPTAASERWSADFVHDQLANGRRIRILNIVDDFSRVCVAQLVDTSISGHRRVRLLDDLGETRGLPNVLNLQRCGRRTSSGSGTRGARPSSQRVYPSFDAAQGRFRLMPPQACKNQFLLDNIGRHSLMQTEGAWCWKFDDELFRKFEFGGNMHEDLARLRCRAGVIYGEDSYLFTQDIADHMFRVLDESVPFAAIPEAQHRLFLDQPATSSRRIGKRRAMKSAELNRMCVVPSRYGFLSA